MLDYLWKGGLPGLKLVDDMEQGLRLTHPDHKCLLGRMVSCLLSQSYTWPSDGVHT
jgi:hypothetical protein